MIGEMVDSASSAMRRLVYRVKDWWRNLSGVQAAAVTIGAVVTAGLIAAGGVAAQGCLMALVVNIFLWRLFYDSNWLWEKIKKYRLSCDGLITLLGFFFSPVPGAAGAFFSIMLGVYFSITRSVLLPPEVGVDEKVVIPIANYRRVRA